LRFFFLFREEELSEQVTLWVIVAAFMAFIFFKGMGKARNVDHSDDFLVAGRNVGWFFFCSAPWAPR
jgi:Na+/proline symporter